MPRRENLLGSLDGLDLSREGKRGNDFWLGQRTIIVFGFSSRMEGDSIHRNGQSRGEAALTDGDAFSFSLLERDGRDSQGNMSERPETKERDQGKSCRRKSTYIQLVTAGTGM
jgi:hypothetical protein